MLSFIIRRCRPADSGGNWLRLFSATQLLRMATFAAFKVTVLIQLFLAPVNTLILLLIGGVLASTLPAIVYQLRYGGWNCWRWSVSFTFYGLFTLCWIPIWGVFTATQSGWLTRDLPGTMPATELKANSGVALTIP
jgi:hyaluronan synthase